MIRDDTFIKFVNEFKNDYNTHLIEAIEDGYSVLFESVGGDDIIANHGGHTTGEHVWFSS